MKTKFDLLTLLGLLSAQWSAAQADPGIEPLAVSARLEIPYYAEFVAENHLTAASRYFDSTLRTFSCLQGDWNTKILIKKKSRWFSSSDIPGKIEYTYATRCFDPGLSKVDLHIGDIGYDEDYTVVSVSVSQGSQRSGSETCFYGLDARQVKCPERERRQ